LAYDARTQDDLAKWWVTGTGSTVNRLSEIMDDMPDGPAIYHVDADDAWTVNPAAADEWYVATATKPDEVAENLAGWHKMTGVADDSETGDGAGLNADEWCYDTDNNRVYIRLSDDSDPNDTDVRKHYAWDGSGAGPAIMTETVEDAIYLIHLLFQVGDDTTSTTLISLNEMVYFDDNCWFTVEGQATLELGEKSGDWGINGSFWNVCPSGATNVYAMTDGSATFNMYDSRLHNRANASKYVFDNGSAEILNSTLTALYSTYGSSSKNAIWISGMDSLILKKVLSLNQSFQGIATVDPTIIDLHCHDNYYGIASAAANVVTIQNANVTGTVRYDVLAQKTSAQEIVILNPSWHITLPALSHADSLIKEAYTVNIHLADKGGNDLSGVSVLIQDASDNIVSVNDSETDLNEELDISETEIDVDDGTKFSVGDIILIDTEFMYVSDVTGNTLTVTRAYYTSPTDGYKPMTHANNSDIYIVGAVSTDVNGDITEQIIYYKQWYGTSMDLSTFSPHKFTLSKPGYETLVLDNITMNGPIDWHLELQPKIKIDVDTNQMFIPAAVGQQFLQKI